MIYHIYANRSNIGDWISAKGIQQLILPEKVTECLCDTPFVSNTIKRLASATPDDFIIIGGGGLLMDYFTPFWRAFQKVADEIPFCIWGIGYCDLKHQHTLIADKLIKRIIHKSRMTIVRDELTRLYLQEDVIPSPIACPSVNYIQQLSEPGKGVMHIVNYEASRKEAYKAMHLASTTFAEKTGRCFYETNHRIVNGSEEELHTILKRYEESDVVVSSALHGCIIGLSMGLKVLAVSGDRKIDAFMQAVGLKEWVLDTHDASRVASKLEELAEQSIPLQTLNQFREKNENVGKAVQTLAGLHSARAIITDS